MCPALGPVRVGLSELALGRAAPATGWERKGAAPAGLWEACQALLLLDDEYGQFLEILLF